jgi:nitrate/nitrite transport system ATP-binding protein
VLLSDRIVMMSNGPAATIGDVLHVELERPRERLALADDHRYNHYRSAVLKFLYERQRHPAEQDGDSGSNATGSGEKREEATEQESASAALRVVAN